jgi:glycerol-3-phosphate dehydrogenase
MAKLCVRGNKRFEALCATLDVPYRRTGKLVVALGEADLLIIDRIIADGKKNGCTGLARVDQAEMRRLEPEIAGAGGLYSADTAVFDPFLYTIHLCEAALQNGVSCFMDNEVREIRKNKGTFIVSTGKDEYQCEILINSAGLYADKIAAMAGDASFTIYPCRGEYFVLDTAATGLLSRPVYPAPRRGVGGLGVHLTVTIDGNVLIGPSAEYIDEREDYATTAPVLNGLFREAQTLLPALREDMIIASYTGIRPKLVPRGQENYGDFIVEESPRVENLINLIGIESPGLTASVPIAETAAEIIRGKRPLKTRANYRAEYRGYPAFASLDAETQDALIRENPGYGEVVCRCKTITRAEILQALHNPLAVHTVSAVKNRLHATRGRCQGGYCLPVIAQIIMDEFKLAPEQVAYRYYGDTPFTGAVK